MLTPLQDCCKAAAIGGKYVFNNIFGRTDQATEILINIAARGIIPCRRVLSAISRMQVSYAPSFHLEQI